MSTISSIMLLLKENAPLTIAQLAETIGLGERSIACAIWRARQGGINIRICGSLKTQNHPYLYEISDKPDVKISKKGCVGKPKHRGRPVTVEPEEYMDQRKAALAAEIQPFRHWQDAALFGDAR